MEVTNESNADLSAQVEAEEHIHLPPPTWAPIILALGLAGIVFGIVLTPLLLISGVVVTIIGLGTWILDEIRNASVADTQAGDQAPRHVA